MISLVICLIQAPSHLSLGMSVQHTWKTNQSYNYIFVIDILICIYKIHVLIIYICKKYVFLYFIHSTKFTYILLYVYTYKHLCICVCTFIYINERMNGCLEGEPTK